MFDSISFLSLPVCDSYKVYNLTFYKTDFFHIMYDKVQYYLTKSVTYKIKFETIVKV